MAVYITGDTHKSFSRIKRFANKMQLTKDDTIVILGDAGINLYLDKRDDWDKLALDMLGTNIFCIQGNHECRPQNIKSYQEREVMGGKVLYERAYPNISFAIDGEVYDIPSVDGTQHKVLICGGAYSVDRQFYSAEDQRHLFFDDEQPDDNTKKKVENKLESLEWTIDDIFTHTAPVNFEPTENFLGGINQSIVDKSTEIWLQSIYDRLNSFGRWYLGHYHCNKNIDNKIFILYEDFMEF